MPPLPPSFFTQTLKISLIGVIIIKPELEKKLQEKLRLRLIKLPEFIVDYIFALEYRKKQLRTRYEYAKDIGLFLEFMIYNGLTKANDIKDISPSDLDKLKERDIWNFLSYLTSYKKTFITSAGNEVTQEFTNSDAGKARKLATLHDFFRYLVDNEIIKRDITSKVDIRVDHKAVIKNRLTPEDIQAFFSVIIDDINIESERMEIFHQKVKFRDYIMVLLLSYTGIRISELVQLDIDDISISEEVMIVVRKGGNQEKITLPSLIIEDIQAYIEERKKIDVDTKALFISLQNRRIHPKTVNLMLDKYRKRANIDIKVSPHVFRRTFGTQHYNRYRDMYLTAQIMGHRSAETTRKFYADPAEERKAQSMANFDYDEAQTPSDKITLTKEQLVQISKATGIDLEKLLNSQ